MPPAAHASYAHSPGADEAFPLREEPERPELLPPETDAPEESPPLTDAPDDNPPPLTDEPDRALETTGGSVTHWKQKFSGSVVLTHDFPFAAQIAFAPFPQASGSHALTDETDRPELLPPDTDAPEDNPPLTDEPLRTDPSEPERDEPLLDEPEELLPPLTDEPERGGWQPSERMQTELAPDDSAPAEEDIDLILLHGRIGGLPGVGACGGLLNALLVM